MRLLLLLSIGLLLSVLTDGLGGLLLSAPALARLPRGTTPDGPWPLLGGHLRGASAEAEGSDGAADSAAY